MLVVAAWAGLVQYSLWRGVIVDDRIALSLDQVLVPNFKPEPADATAAAGAERLLRRATPPEYGGIGWKQAPEVYLRLARLAAIGGNIDEAEKQAKRAAALAPATSGDESAAVQRAFLSVVNRTSGGSPDAIVAACREILAKSPHLFEVRLRLAQIEVGRRNMDIAIQEAGAAAADGSKSTFAQGFAGQVLVQAGRPELGLARFVAASKLDPHAAGPHIGQAIALTMMGRLEDAEAQAKAATELEPESPNAWQVLGGIYQERGKEAEAAACEARLEAILSKRAAGNK
jgi:Flp pilus assembly protein TadD